MANNMKDGSIVSIPGSMPVGSFAKDSGKPAMKRNPKLAKTNVRTPKIAGNGSGKGLGPSVSAPISANYETRKKK